MKVLSLKQPYAELVVSGKKKIELRKWNTKFRGEFLIHASKNPDEEAMNKFGFSRGSLPLGFIIGKAKLVEVKHYKNEEEHNRDKDLHIASGTWGDYGFVLFDVEKFEKPIKAKGQLGFWEFEV